MPKILLAMVLGVLLSELRLPSEARTPPYGVKLCGREFIRAVIFTCGGSRWRRAGNVGALPGGDSAEAFAATSSSDEWVPIHAPPKDPSDYYGSWHGQQSHSPSEESWGFDRGARDVLAGLSNACCKWGCSKSEISSLC
uniref:relaxin-3-like n=1 Tax=Podarcis muralis TaxID=64176 RepID=UPI00109F616C|nr:relaxin-3-like [Podarcis muralis]